jgi:hypothetical protein
VRVICANFEIPLYLLLLLDSCLKTLTALVQPTGYLVQYGRANKLSRPSNIMIYIVMNHYL